MKDLIERIRRLTDAALPLCSNLANTAAALNAIPDLNWCGFYLAEGETLYVGPFQGEPACAAIAFGKGVCGTAAVRKESVTVDDVAAFPGHIACSSRSRSELVVPILREGRVLGVIDLDSPDYARFDPALREAIEEIAKILAPLFP